jgi:hypothetical protein
MSGYTSHAIASRGERRTVGGSTTTAVRLRIVVTNPPTGTGTTFGIQDKSWSMIEAARDRALETEVEGRTSGTVPATWRPMS